MVLFNDNTGIYIKFVYVDDHVFVSFQLKMEIDESRVKLECILTTDAKRSSKDDKIKPFTSETWIKVQNAARARLSLIKSSKYDVICRNLSSSFQSKDGYHYFCYKTFTALRKPQ